MKIYCLQAMRRSIILGKERCFREAGGEEELAIIKSLIMLDRKVAIGARYFRSTKIDQNCELILFNITGILERRSYSSRSDPVLDTTNKYVLFKVK